MKDYFPVEPAETADKPLMQRVATELRVRASFIRKDDPEVAAVFSRLARVAMAQQADEESK